MIPYICPLCFKSFNPCKRTPPVSVHLCICSVPRVSAYGRFECIELNSISYIKYSVNLISQSSKGSLQPKIPGKQTEAMCCSRKYPYSLNCLAISRFSDSPWDLESKSWDRELIPQTVSLTVKLWELIGRSVNHMIEWEDVYLHFTNWLHDCVACLTCGDGRCQKRKERRFGRTLKTVQRNPSNQGRRNQKIPVRMIL